MALSYNKDTQTKTEDVPEVLYPEQGLEVVASPTSPYLSTFSSRDYISAPPRQSGGLIPVTKQDGQPSFAHARPLLFAALIAATVASLVGGAIAAGLGVSLAQAKKDLKSVGHSSVHQPWLM